MPNAVIPNTIHSTLSSEEEIEMQQYNLLSLLKIILLEDQYLHVQLEIMFVNPLQ